MGGMWPSEVDDSGNGTWSGGGTGGNSGGRPWWDFPTPLGPPKHQNLTGACFQERVTLDGETFGQPVGCGPMWGNGHVFTGSFMEAWAQWFRGSEDRPPSS